MREVSTRRSNGASLIVVVFLVISLGFAAYLYPLPGENLERVLSSMTPAERAQVGEALESTYWSSWLTNVTLLALGVSSGTLWLIRDGTMWRAWGAVVGVVGFLLICSAILLTQGGDAGVIDSKVALLKQLSSAHAWWFLTAEIHRLLAIVIALVTAIAMAIELRAKVIRTSA